MFPLYVSVCWCARARSSSCEITHTHQESGEYTTQRMVDLCNVAEARTCKHAWWAALQRKEERTHLTGCVLDGRAEARTAKRAQHELVTIIIVTYARPRPAYTAACSVLPQPPKPGLPPTRPSSAHSVTRIQWVSHRSVDKYRPNVAVSMARKAITLPYPRASRYLSVAERVHAE